MYVHYDFTSLLILRIPQTTAIQKMSGQGEHGGIPLNSVAWEVKTGKWQA